jgi:carbon-monoxide dehydrogenase small subunit
MRLRIALTVNGRRRSVDVEPRKLLADVLREELELTGTHLGCEHGVCGACTVLCDGRPVRSCLMFGVQADGARIETVEGLAPPGGLHPIQQAFWEEHGLQCGFCTSGMLMTAKYLLARCPAPTRQEIREAIAGNLCRCTGYTNIVNAIERAAAALATSPAPESADPRIGRP